LQEKKEKKMIVAWTIRSMWNTWKMEEKKEYVAMVVWI